MQNPRRYKLRVLDEMLRNVCVNGHGALSCHVRPVAGHQPQCRSVASASIGLSYYHQCRMDMSIIIRQANVQCRNALNDLHSYRACPIPIHHAP
jgi:hypothetical protein